MGTKEFNKSAYDQVLIRFPKGTVKKFHFLFGENVHFNGWVVNLVTSRLLMRDEQIHVYEHEKM